MSETETETNSNVNATLEAIKAEVANNLDRATGAGLDTLLAFRDIGRGLLEAKEAIGTSPKGAFGKWCDENLTFSKEWRARLMRLASDWKGVQAAMAWAQRMGRILGRKEYSVDGALSLLAEWIKAAPEEAEALGFGEAVQKAEEAAAKAQERAREKADAKQAEETEAEAEALRRMLAEAMQRIADLEAALAKAQGKAGDTKAEAAGAKVDKAAQARARKVYAMAMKGATVGERSAARGRIEEIAGKLDMTTLDFLGACGLDGSAYEAQARADAEEVQSQAD